MGKTLMTREEKQQLYEPKSYALYENEKLINVYDSHKAAKKAKYYYSVQANKDMLDLSYTIKQA
jgi:hypothetical protein